LKISVAIFIVGLALVASPVYVGWLGSGNVNGLRALAGALAIVLAVMLVQGVRSAGSQRWVYLGFVGLLVLGFSAFAILSFGVLIAPVGLALVAVSASKLLKRPTRNSREK
jgi:hypothetical protein